MINFNADEIFEIAEQIERNGARFYRAAAESADGDAEQFLLKLAAMEDDHEKTFAEMRSALAASEKKTVTFDPQDEGAQYLQAMADGRVFRGDPCELLAGGKSMDEVIEIAISLEKDSIIFYQCMKPLVPAELGRDRLHDIINQEIGHILLLTKAREGYTPTAEPASRQEKRCDETGL